MKAVLTNLVTLLNTKQFAKFAIVGCLNVLVSFIVFILCYKVWPFTALVLDAAGSLGWQIETLLAEFGIHGMDAALANVVGYLAGMINSFILNKLWTFEAQGDAVRQAHRFFILNVLGLMLSTIIIFVFVDLLSGPYVVVWFITVGVVMMLNFFGNKYWTFADSSHEGISY